jgi:hypothetical protein
VQSGASEQRLPASLQTELLSAVVDDAGDFAAEVFAVDDHVDEAVFEHEPGGLKAVRQLDLDRLGDDDITPGGEAGGDAAGGWVGQDRNEQVFGGVTSWLGLGHFDLEDV